MNAILIAPTRILVMALPAGRLIVDRVVGHGWSVTEAAMAAGVSDRTAYRWLRRFGEQGRRGRGQAEWKA